MSEIPLSSCSQARQFSKALTPGVGINLLVSDLDLALVFQRELLQAKIAYADADFAVINGYGGTWMLHADHTYRRNPLSGLVKGAKGQGRGLGAEFRIYGCDPDAAEKRAQALGYTILAGTMNKPHGLRECVILDPDGYAWVPGVPSR
jgi:predicted enzyme related to lactoylglutathione lyase